MIQRNWLSKRFIYSSEAIFNILWLHACNSALAVMNVETVVTNEVAEITVPPHAHSTSSVSLNSCKPICKMKSASTQHPQP